jgi:mono/diheme cytochrome c family protein
MLALPMVSALFLALALAPEPTPAAAPPASAAAPDPALEAAVRKIFDEACTMCHSAGGDPTDPGALDLESSPTTMIGKKSVVVDKVLVVPGDPSASYLVDKLYGTAAMKGDLMPQGMDPLSKEQLEAVNNWIKALPKDAGATGPTGPTGPTGDGPTPPVRSPKPFHGTDQIVLPTTSTLGKRTLQYRIDHRFGRIGTERGAFGLDAGVVMSMGLQYGILDGWDVRLRRGNSRKAWELGTKYVPVRQEAGMPLSFGMYASVDFMRDFDVANPWSGNFMAMLSRLWFERWATMLTLGYHLRTDHNPRPMVDFGEGPELVKDTRGTFALGLATSVYLGKRKQWGIDLEWLLPIPDGGDPNKFYYRGGDTDPGGSKIGAWGLGGSYTTGKHFFQVFFTNNREIHTNLAAPGGQSGNPFKTEGVDSKNPFHKANFFLGFNLGRNFTLGMNAEANKEKRKAKRNAKKGGA